MSSSWEPQSDVGGSDGLPPLFGRDIEDRFAEVHLLPRFHCGDEFTWRADVVGSVARGRSFLWGREGCVHVSSSVPLAQSEREEGRVAGSSAVNERDGVAALELRRREKRKRDDKREYPPFQRRKMSYNEPDY